MELQRAFAALMLVIGSNAGASAQNDASLYLDRLPDCMTAVREHGQAALEAASDWIDREPTWSSVQCLATIQGELGMKEEAIGSLERAIDLTGPGEEYVASNLLTNAAHYATILGQRDRAIALFDRAVAQPGLYDDYRGELMFQRAMAHIVFGEFDEAADDLADARNLAPDDADILIVSADVAARDGDAEATANFLGRALEIDPTDAAIAVRVGEIAYGLGAIETARQAWGRALELEPHGPMGELAAARLAEVTDSESGNSTPDSH